MSAIDKAVEAALAREIDSLNEPSASQMLRADIEAAVAAGHLVPADDPDALLAALVRTGRVEKVEGAAYIGGSRIVTFDRGIRGARDLYVIRESGS